MSQRHPNDEAEPGSQISLEDGSDIALRTNSEEAKRAALAIRGSLTETEAEELVTETAALRRSWRGSR